MEQAHRTSIRIYITVEGNNTVSNQLITISEHTEAVYELIENDNDIGEDAKGLHVQV